MYALCTGSMCLAVASNGLDEDCGRPAAAPCGTDKKPKKKVKKQNGTPEEGTGTETTPAQNKKKKKRKLTDTAEPPGEGQTRDNDCHQWIVYVVVN